VAFFLLTELFALFWQLFDIFTRCDVVGTWSREYQLSSSSHSHSYSYSPDDSLFLAFTRWDKICNNFLITFWQLFDNFLTTFWQLFDNFFDNFLTVFDNFLTIFWPTFNNFWQLFDNFLTTFANFCWLFFILMVVASCLNKYYGTNFIYAVPTYLLIAPGLWTIQFLFWQLFDNFLTTFWLFFDKFWQLVELLRNFGQLDNFLFFYFFLKFCFILYEADLIGS
jgi:hypothetical protein